MFLFDIKLVQPKFLQSIVCEFLLKRPLLTHFYGTINTRKIVFFFSYKKQYFMSSSFTNKNLSSVVVSLSLMVNVLIYIP